MPLMIITDKKTKKNTVVHQPDPPKIGIRAPMPISMAAMVYPEMQQVQDMILKNRDHFRKAG